MRRFDKVQKLSHKQSKEIVAFCGTVALLLLIAGFIAGGGAARMGKSIALNGISPTSLIASVFPCSWDGSCPSSPGSWVASFAPASQTITVGKSATLLYQAYDCGPNGCAGDCYYSASMYAQFGHYFRGGMVCDINANAPNTSYSSGIVVNNPSDQLSVGVAQTPYIVTPSQTTTYYFCASIHIFEQGIGCQAATVTVVCPAGYTGTPPSCVAPAPTCSNGLNINSYPSCTCPANQIQSGSACVAPSIPNPTVTIDAGAGPGATRTVTVGTPVTISATFTPGSGDIITNTSLVDYQSNALPGISTAVPPTSKSYVFTPSAAGSYIFYPSVQTSAYPAWSNYGRSVTVMANAPTCADGLNSSYAPSCTCPSGQVQSGSACVAATCSNGLAYATYGPSCTCPASQHLSGSACAANPLCSNGLNDSYAPSCMCPAGQYQPLGASTCVPLPTCANGLNQSYSPSCTCPSGKVQVQGGSTCVLAGVINTLTEVDPGPGTRDRRN
jgi:hypothetical protein